MRPRGSQGLRRIAVIVTAAVTFGVSSCADESFQGGTKKKAPFTATPPGDDARRCLPEPLPASVVTPKKLFTFEPSGVGSNFNEFVSTVAVGRLSKDDNAPTILAIGFKRTTSDCNGAVHDPGMLFAIDGQTGAQKWFGRNAAGAPFDLDAAIAPAIADVDNDGKMEVFAINRTTGRVIAFNSDGVVLWASTEANGTTPAVTGSRGGAAGALMWAHGISVVDLEGDGKPEVIAPGMVVNARTGVKKFALPGGRHVYPANVNLAGASEVVVSTGVVNASGATVCRFSSDLANLGIARLRRDDPHLTIIGPSISNPVKLVAYRGDNCAQIFAKPFGDDGGGPPNLADFDGAPDQVLEIGIAGKARYAVFSASGDLLWSRPTQDASSARTGSTAFDFNGDGKTEVVYNDERFLRVFDGASGNVLYESPNTSYTAHEYPVVADVDGNGTANIVAVANACANAGGNRGVIVFAEPSDNWVRTRPVWSQHGFDPLAIRDDGSVTGVDASAILSGALSSPHLAGFRNNIAFPRDPAQCK